MFCINCGTKLPDGAKFCFNCGARMPEMPNGTVPESAPAADKEAGASAGSTAAPEAPATSGQPVAETAPAPVEETLPDVPGSQCVILSKYHIDFPRPLALRRQLWASFNREGARQRRLVGRYIREHVAVEEYTDPASLVGDLTRIIFNACDPSIEAAVEVLLNHGIDFISKKIWKTDFLSSTRKQNWLPGWPKTRR